jgi:hypothetical protein
MLFFFKKFPILVLQMCSGPEKGIVWMSVGEDAVTILELGSMALKARYPYSSVVTFGGCQDDFMLVVSREAEGKGTSQRLLFALSQAKVKLISFK